MDEKMRVSVKIHPTIREYIIDTNGSDVITLSKSHLLWKIVKYNLSTCNEETVLREDINTSYIYIELMNSHGIKSYVSENLSNKKKKNQKKSKDYIYIDTSVRCFLNENGNTEVANELRKRFKESLHTFVLGALTTNKELQQKEAFEKFIEHFHLSNNKVTYEMIKKSWDRSPQKKSLVGKGRFCSIIF